MKFVIISDTHNLHKELILPKGDVIIHCGDFTSSGYEHEITSFIQWFGNLDYKYKIFIAGNHEITLDYDFYEENWKRFHKKKQNIQKIKELVENNNNVIYLKDTHVTIEGIKIYGSPYTLDCNLGWAFPLYCDSDCDYKWKNIPNDIDVLITHTPPEGILDFYKKNLGCDILLVNVIDRVKPKIHCFGHIHSGSGILTQNDIIFINASVIEENYKITYKHKTIELNIN